MPDLATEISSFWKGVGPSGWYSKSDALDEDIRRQFGEHCKKALAGDYAAWSASPETCLSLLLLLDQFPRNIYRGDARAFASDSLARAVAVEALGHGHPQHVDPVMRDFFYLPFMHSEHIADQRLCVKLMHAHSNENALKYAILHRDIILRFGRFPHRNPALGRHTTPAEQAFLDNDGFKG